MRGLVTQVLVTTRRKNAHVVGRLDSPSSTKPCVRLHDGSSLVKLYRASQHQTDQVLTARVMKSASSIRKPELSAAIRLMTTLLEPKPSTSGSHLLRVSHERWEIDLGYDEITTHRSWSARTLRSHTPQGVEHELDGMLPTPPVRFAP